MSFLLSNKELKKWKKARHKLLQDGLEICDHSSNCIVIANGGLGNGITVHQMLELLENFGDITSLISCCAKSYAIAAFSGGDSAMKCYTSLQGHKLLKSAEKNSSVLFIYYLSHLPKHLSNYTDKSSWVFEDSKEFPKGLLKFENFITAEEEQQLTDNIEKDLTTLSADHIQEDLKRRTVVHYGYKFRYGSNDVDCLNPLDDKLPQFSQPVIEKLLHTGYFTEKPDQLTINKYMPGDGIPPHIDNPTAFAEPLATLSLGSATVMEMKSTDGTKVSILLKPRTLIIFTSDSRYLWTHSIQARKTDLIYNDSMNTPYLLKRSTRLSMTFRKVLTETTNSASVPVCKQLPSDSSDVCVLPSDSKEANDFEIQRVHNVYDNIAQHFSCTREKPWPKVVEFLNSLDHGAVVLDVGCGSGRYLNANTNIVTVGCDYCASLVEICSKKHNYLFVCDGLNLPVRSNCFDACICIAVIHHYSTFERQVYAIKELLRIIRYGGLCLIYVWAIEQKLNDNTSSYLKQNSQFDKSSKQTMGTSEPGIEKVDFQEQIVNLEQSDAGKLVIHKNRTEFKQQNVLVPWKTKSNVSKALQKKFGDISVESGATYYRFYHVFKENELEKICNNLPDCTVVRSYYDNGNWSVIIKKC